MSDLENLMQKAKEMQDQMQHIQSQIQKLKVVGQSKDGTIKIVLNGAHKAEDVKVSPTVTEEDEKAIGDKILEAINNATDQVEEETRKLMMKISQDIQLPEDGGLLN